MIPSVVGNVTIKQCPFHGNITLVTMAKLEGREEFIGSLFTVKLLYELLFDIRRDTSKINATGILVKRFTERSVRDAIRD